MQIVEISDQIIALHQRLPGEPLRSVQDLTDPTQDRLAVQLGNFLQSLHQIEPDLLSDIKLPHIDQRWWANFLNRVERLIFPKIASTTAEILRYQVQSHIQQLPNLPRVLRHGDFGSSNILWDSKGHITGIIDFGSLGWGDPGWDIAGLFVSYGSPFVKRLASTYPTIEALLERSPFYRSMFVLMDAVFGAEHGDSETLDFGLDTIHRIV